MSQFKNIKIEQEKNIRFAIEIPINPKNILQIDHLPIENNNNLVITIWFS